VTSANSRNAPHAKLVRAQILLAAHDHPEWDNQQIAQEVGRTGRRATSKTLFTSLNGAITLSAIVLFTEC
jgi:hypothetical protein